jgi:hypothetical protein
MLAYCDPVLRCFIRLSVLACVLDAATLSIHVIEGQNAINNINRATAFEPVVEVRDGSGQPVSGATVTFQVPAMGPSGTFVDGGTTLMVHTDAQGRATARGLRPNKITGPFDIRVTAASAGQSATATIAQTNAAPAMAASKSGRKWAIVLGVVGGAVAAGAVAATGGGNAAAPRTASDPPAGSVTPGAPGFGPPR